MTLAPKIVSWSSCLEEFGARHRRRLIHYLYEQTNHRRTNAIALAAFLQSPQSLRVPSLWFFTLSYISRSIYFSRYIQRLNWFVRCNFNSRHVNWIPLTRCFTKINWPNFICMTRIIWLVLRNRQFAPVLSPLRLCQVGIQSNKQFAVVLLFSVLNLILRSAVRLSAIVCVWVNSSGIVAEGEDPITRAFSNPLHGNLSPTEVVKLQYKSSQYCLSWKVSEQAYTSVRRPSCQLLTFRVWIWRGCGSKSDISPLVTMIRQDHRVTVSRSLVATFLNVPTGEKEQRKFGIPTRRPARYGQPQILIRPSHW